MGAGPSTALGVQRRGMELLGGSRAREVRFLRCPCPKSCGGGGGFGGRPPSAQSPVSGRWDSALSHSGKVAIGNAICFFACILSLYLSPVCLSVFLSPFLPVSPSPSQSCSPQEEKKFTIIYIKFYYIITSDCNQRTQVQTLSLAINFE